METLTPDELGELLIYGAREASPDVQYIQDLITVGCPIDARDLDGWTALHYVANWGKIEIVKFLISNGANVNARDKWGHTALYYAAWGGHLEVVKFLISQGADINSRGFGSNSETPWDKASELTRQEIPELNPNT